MGPMLQMGLMEVYRIINGFSALERKERRIRGDKYNPTITPSPLNTMPHPRTTHLMDRRPVCLLHLVELVDAADPPVCQDQRTALKDQLLGHLRGWRLGMKERGETCKGTYARATPIHMQG